MKTVPVARLHELLDYEPTSGELRWKARSLVGFSSENRRAIWNARYAGTVAGCVDSGYRNLKIDGQKYKAHRIAWAIQCGEWPSAEIDHINGDGTDNRFCNLRHVDGSENKKNKPLPKNNTSGVMGVHWRKDKELWAATIGVAGKILCLGFYPTIKHAALVRKHHEKIYGFHENHGRQGAIQ